jgi:hypothetical protein
MRPDVLAAECRIFSAYLIGEQPTPYVVQKYRQAHAMNSALSREAATPFDAITLKLVRACPGLLGLVDAYSALFRKRALVRAKLILVLSLLEVSNPSYRHFDAAEPRGTARLGGVLAYRGLLSMATLLLAVALLGPVDAVCSRAAQGDASDARKHLRDAWLDSCWSAMEEEPDPTPREAIGAR